MQFDFGSIGEEASDISQNCGLAQNTAHMMDNSQANNGQMPLTAKEYVSTGKLDICFQYKLLFLL